MKPPRHARPFAEVARASWVRTFATGCAWLVACVVFVALIYLVAPQAALQ